MHFANILSSIKGGVYFLAVLSVLVVVHEWGHFIVAKLCKMRVDDFSLFFGKVLIRLGVHNGTEYNIRSIPLGGFVKIAGMEPDDISNGAPIFKRKDVDNPVTTQKEFLKTMQGLSEESLSEVNFDNVSERVALAVEQSIEDKKLTSNGKEELRALLASTAINPDEHRYMEAVLAADSYVVDPAGYNQKPLWQRASVIFAGPLLSLAFGYLLFCVMGVTMGLPDLTNKHIAIGSLVPGKPAQLAGMEPGDYVLTINGKDITTLNDPLAPIHDNPGTPIQVVMMRQNTPMTFTVTPYGEEAEVLEHGKKVKKTIGLLGFKPDLPWARYSPLESMKRGTQLVYIQVMGLVNLFTHFSEAKRSVGGIISIAGEINENSKQGSRQVFFTAAMLSVSLGLFNLLPIPILDGGHLMLLAIEGIRRRKLSGREVYAAQLVGLSIIGVLFVFVMYNDIMRVFFHR